MKRKELADVQAALARTRATLRTLMVWMAQSANSPISVKEVEQLLRLLDVDAKKDKR